MSRFYINDGNRPGRRTPQLEYGQKGGAGSDCLNEAQAIAKGRKLTATQSALRMGRYVRLSFDVAFAPLDSRINVRLFSVFNDLMVNVASARPVALTGPGIYGGTPRNDITIGSYSDSLWYAGDDALIVTTPRRTLTVDLGAIHPIKRVSLTPMWTGSWTIGVTASEDGVTWTTLKADAAFNKTGADQTLYLG